MDTGTEAFDSPLLDYALDSYRKLRPPVKRRKRAPVTTPVLRLFHKQLHRSALWNSAIKAATHVASARTANALCLNLTTMAP